MIRAFILPLIILILGQAKASQTVSSGKHQVCSITLNSDNEIKTFKKNLSSKDFTFTELTEMGDRTTWFENACKSQLKCDVVVISGHFAGEFFGKSDKSLKADTLEEKSCKKSCDGILKNPQEVFLFGCNTLSEKSDVDKSPDAIYESLRKRGLDSVAIERIIQSRYGKVGLSFKDKLRRSFSNVPHLYGFDLIGPSGDTVQPKLESYFKTTQDYNKHISDLKSAAAMQLVAKSNTALQKSMTMTDFTQCGGLNKTDKNYLLNEKVCSLFSDDIPLSTRLETAKELLLNPLTDNYLSSVNSFLEINKSKISAADLQTINTNSQIRDRLKKLKNENKQYATAFLDLAQLEKNLKITTESEFQTEYSSVVKTELQKNTPRSVDTICALQKNFNLNANIGYNDFPAYSLKSDQTARATHCIQTTDWRITRDILQGVENKTITQTTNMIALAHLPGFEKDISNLAEKMMHATDPNSQMTGQYLFLAKSTDNAERLKLARQMANDPLQREVLINYLEKTNYADRALAALVKN